MSEPFRIVPFDILPEEWQADSFIAGGFAAYPALASDIDLWVTVPTGNDLEGVRAELVLHLQAKGFVYAEQKDREEGARINNDDPEDYPMFLDNRKVAVVTARHGFKYAKPIHIIVTNGDVDEVLRGFDISTHQIALLLPFTNPTEHEGNDYTRLDEEPRILKDTPHTRERYARIRERYADFRATSKLESALEGHRHHAETESV